MSVNCLHCHYLEAPVLSWNFPQLVVSEFHRHFYFQTVTDLTFFFFFLKGLKLFLSLLAVGHSRHYEHWLSFFLLDQNNRLTSQF